MYLYTLAVDEVNGRQEVIEHDSTLGTVVEGDEVDLVLHNEGGVLTVEGIHGVLEVRDLNRHCLVLVVLLHTWSHYIIIKSKFYLMFTCIYEKRFF